jgi:acetylornithine deacetylase/succinyl-diaminopimelate desuccinylase-like protein
MLHTLIFVAASSLQGIAAANIHPDEALFRSIYEELVEIDTTPATGNTVLAAEAMAARLTQNGFTAGDIKVLSSAPRKGNLVVRLRGRGTRKPLLLVAHLDVVDARREDWDFDPFQLQEVDGYFRARGAADDKAMAAIFIANLIRYRREGWNPSRDIIVALTADEELSDSEHNGMRWLLENHRTLVDAEFAINEGGAGTMRNGKRVAANIQLAEKIYQSFYLKVKDPGGHSALPRKDNAITRLSEGLVKLANYEFPARLNPVTRAWLEIVTQNETSEIKSAIAALESGITDGRDIFPLTNQVAYNAQIRTTCVATMLEAGHAENAMAQSARATINCRLLPDEDPQWVRETLEQVLADENIEVQPLGAVVQSPPSPMLPEVMSAVSQISQSMWPGVPVIPIQSGGYTDSRWLRKHGIPAFGVSGLFIEEGKSGVHGLNEQVEVQALLDSKTFLYALVKQLGQ